MNSKISSAHLGRDAVVHTFVNRHLVTVHSHTESKRRQYDLAESARKTGFANVTVIDDDFGRSGSGLMERPDFQKLVAAVWRLSWRGVLHRGVAPGAQRP